MVELRDKYLWAFAYVLHIPPPQVDALRLVDFCNLILGIDEYKAELERRNE